MVNFRNIICNKSLKIRMKCFCETCLRNLQNINWANLLIMKGKGFKILNTKFILTPNKYLFFTFLKNNCMKKIFTLLLLSFFTVSIVSAQSLLNEGFNYSIGNLTTVGAPSWVSFAGGATPVPIKVV